MIIIPSSECPQNSPQWHKKRLGNPGASNIGSIITAKGEPSKSAPKLLETFFNEVIDGEKEDTFYSYDMKKGHEREQESINHWQMRNMVEVERPGIIFPYHRRWHISPDGIMPEINKGFETKNAKATVHLERVRIYNKTGKIESRHWMQSQMSISVTGYDAWIYQSYCRNLEPLTVEIYPNFEWIKKMEAALEEFVFDLSILVKGARNV